MTPGIYHLLIHLPQESDIVVGKLGRFHFPAGYYVYTGSALNGLESRIARHLRRRKRLHWHIDYLLQHGHVIDVITHRTGTGDGRSHRCTTAVEISGLTLECRFNQRILSLPDSKIPVKGFGSSDCRCPSHLIYFKEKPDIPQNLRIY